MDGIRLLQCAFFGALWYRFISIALARSLARSFLNVVGMNFVGNNNCWTMDDGAYRSNLCCARSFLNVVAMNLFYM